MLHILWLLIKFILILLGIVLGLILLALLFLLFCPVRYRAEAAKETDSFRKIYAKARISWLFGAVSFRLQYVEGNAISDLRLFGLPVMKLLQKFRSRHRSRTGTSTQTSGDASLSDQNGTDTETKVESRTTTGPAFGTDTPTSDSAAEISTETEEDTEEQERLEYIRQKFCSFFYRLGRLCHSIQNRFRRLWQKISHIPSSVENIRLTFQNICAKIKSYQDFLEHPRVRAALSLLKDRSIKLLRHVFPTRLEGRLTFGSTDPSVTGSVLAILGMTMPLHQNRIAVTPIFEDRNILRGNIRLKGRIYGWVLIKTAVELYFNKNIKYIIRRWKHK